MNIGNTDIVGVGKKRIFERASSDPYSMEKRSRYTDERALHSVPPLSTHESFESGGLSEADAQEVMEKEDDYDSGSQPFHQQEAELPRNNHSNDHSNDHLGNNGNCSVFTPAEKAALDKLGNYKVPPKEASTCSGFTPTQKENLDKLGHYERNAPTKHIDNTKKEWQERVDSSFEVHQYREDELQHDGQEEDLNQGHTHTQRKSHTRKPDPYQWLDEPISWDDRIQDLKAVKEICGHCMVKRGFKDNPALASFVTKMRDYKNRIKRGTYTGSFLTPARITELDELGFEWSQKKPFEDRVDQLKAFKESHGHIRVTESVDASLTGFIRSMRRARSNPGSGRMTITEERIKALDDLGFKWTTEQKQTFEQSMEQLKAFKKAHGHLRVTDILDKKLYIFCCKTREARRNPDSTGTTIAEERIKALDDIGFQWGAQAQSFEQRIGQLKVFKEAHGHLRVTKSLDKKLATFCVHMRRARRNPNGSGNMTITEERIKAMDDLGFEWGAQRMPK